LGGGTFGVVKPCRRGKAASMSSIFTPFRDSTAGGISSKCKITGWSGPNIIPRAIIGTKAYPICPAEKCKIQSVLKKSTYSATCGYYQQMDSCDPEK
jgi:hypothetical protein